MAAEETAVKSTNQNPRPVKLLLAEPETGRYELMQRVLRHGARGQKYCRNYSHFADAATEALRAGVLPPSSHCRGAAQWSTPVFLPGESHGQRRLVGYSPWGRKELEIGRAHV